jgi:two-component system CheB/CheR fusion protein
MDDSAGARRHDEATRLLDENEQLRTALESSLDENNRLTDDRDRLLRRVTVLARELQAANTAYSQVAEPPPQPNTHVEAEARQSQTDEELRVAFEELQVLTEELEVANTSLHQINAQLEMRVEERTRELARTNNALRTSEAAFRTLVEGMPQLVWRSRTGGDWTWSSPQWSDYTGQPQAESLRDGWLKVLHPDDQAAAEQAWATAADTGTLEFEARIFHAKEARHRHFHTRAAPLRAGDRVVEWLGTSTDVDDIMQLQRRQSVLVTELQHRTRNLMAIVQAVMMRTIKGSKSLDEFRRCIDDRMQALARTQGLLSRRGTGRVTFDELLFEELSAHVELGPDGCAPQVSTEGPRGITLHSSIVQTFALAIHELSTNASKYGALAAPGRHLEVRWALVPAEGSAPRLRVEWSEYGVDDMPDIGAGPQGGGYGRELIERALPYQLGAKTSYGFAADGVRCTIEVVVSTDGEMEDAQHGR